MSSSATMMLAPRPLRVSSDPDILVTGWMEENAAGLHPVFRKDGGYEAQRAEAKQNQSQADDMTLDFCNIMHYYQHTLNSKDLKKTYIINLHEAHTWEEVMQAASSAESAYHAKASRSLGFKGSLRKFFRLTGDYAVATRPWTGLLPNDSYMSVVCGGLKLVFDVAAKRSERREEILETFDELPSLVMRTQRCHELFPSNLILRDRALAVYLNLLSMIEAMLSTLLDKKFLARIKDGLRGPLADRPLDERRRLFNRSVSDLEEQVQYLHLQSSQRAHNLIEKMAPSLQRTETLATQSYILTNEIGQDIRDLGDHVTDLSERSRNMGSQVSDLHSSAGIIETGLSRLHTRFSAFSSLTWKYNKQLEANTQAMQKMESVLQDVVQSASWRDEKITQRILYQTNALNSQSRGDLRMFQAGVLSLIGVELDADIPRLEAVMRASQFIDQQEQGRVQYSLRTPQFKTFLQSRESSILLLNGNGSDGMARWSSMSLLTALLANSLSQDDSVIVLPFFCGNHNSFGDSVSGPKGLIRVLLTQLLATYSFDLGFVRFGSWFEGLRAHDLSTLCRLFHKLLTQLPSVTVVVLVDGISLFETSRWEDHVSPVVRRLLASAQDDSLDCRLKVLFTSPTVSRLVRDVIGEENVLSVPGGAVGNGEGLTERGISRSLTPSPGMERRELVLSRGESNPGDWIPRGWE